MLGPSNFTSGLPNFMKEAMKRAALPRRSLMRSKSRFSSIPPQCFTASASDMAPNTLVPFQGFEKSFIHDPSGCDTLFSI